MTSARGEAKLGVMPQRPVTPEEILAAKAKSPDMQKYGEFLWGRVFDDGRCLYLAPSPELPGRLFLGIARDMDVKAYYAVWEYEPSDVAWHAALGWDGEGEPEGYLRRVLVSPRHTREASV